jgi:hypothetical protein
LRLNRDLALSMATCDYIDDGEACKLLDGEVLESNDEISRDVETLQQRSLAPAVSALHKFMIRWSPERLRCQVLPTSVDRSTSLRTPWPPYIGLGYKPPVKTIRFSCTCFAL